MFAGALSYNQNIGNWDVSSSYYFVSIVMNDTNVVVYESNHLTHNLLLLFLVILFMHRISCLKEHLYLTKTLAIGMFQVVITL